MSRVARGVVLATVLVSSAMLLQGSLASAVPPSGDRGRGREVTLEFDVETSPFNYTDLGAEGLSAADVIVFHDRLLREQREVGHQVGSCVLVDETGLANCTGVVTLDGQGTIAFAFENAPPPRKALAITGGTAAFRTARGDGVFVEHGDGTAALTLRLSRR